MSQQKLYVSKRGLDFYVFCESVLGHIETYTVPQYGDKGEDQCTGYTAEDCVKQAMKYMSRFGRNSREGQQELDFKKVAHYIQMAHDKYIEEKKNEH
jgi:hypothetical protein